MSRFAPSRLRQAGGPHHGFFLMPLSQRIVGLDAVRGCAILAMTLYHQSLVIRPGGGWGAFAEFLGYLSAPLFLYISGAAAALHERRHRWPLKMTVHGGLLFLMAYAIDLVVLRDARVDWDIFQIIGACYAGLGLLGTLGQGLLRHAALAAVLLVPALVPALRPDRGFFPPWPFGLYFAAGYLMAQFGLSSRLRRWSIRCSALAGLVGFLLVFSWNPPPDRTRPEGFLFLLALAYALLVASLEAERLGLLGGRGFAVMVRWGRYPLTLYFAQQLATVARLRLPLPLAPSGAWLVQAAALLALMHAATFVLERFPALDVGWWLRQAERLALRGATPRGAPGPS
jgi:peptidoglycan/LPS O-acetylase OafA/YrhL